MNMPLLYSAWNADNRGYGSPVGGPQTQIAKNGDLVFT